MSIIPLYVISYHCLSIIILVSLFPTAGSLRATLLTMKRRREQPLSMQSRHRRKGNNFSTKQLRGEGKRRPWPVRDIDNTWRIESRLFSV